MTHARFNAALGTLLVIISSVAYLGRVDFTRPHVVFLPEMTRSPASDAFEANPALRDGRTLQTPIDGTVARGEMPLYFEPTKEDAERAGRELENPFSRTDQTSDASDLARRNASVQRGARLFGTFCVACHGPSGGGDGPVAKRGFPPPPSLISGKSVQMQDGQLFHILTYGQGSMSSMAAQLSRESRWDVINYVRSMQLAVPNPAGPASGAVDANASPTPLQKPEVERGQP